MEISRLPVLNGLAGLLSDRSYRPDLVGPRVRELGDRLDIRGNRSGTPGHRYRIGRRVAPEHPTMNVWRAVIVVLWCVVASGCASTIRDRQPVKVMSSRQALDPLSSCLVRELNEVSKTLTNDLAKSLGTAQTITNQIRVVDPKRSYEIGPLQPTMTELYAVKLIAETESQTKIEIYSDASNAGYSVLTPRLLAAVSKCERP